ncbi:MAG: hypothetical protein R2807_05720 [Chitinophagales bacterium]
MDKALAEKYPMIKTYHAIGVNNPTITAKLDYTAFGFHAMVFSEKGIYYIDPYSSSNTGYYNCYYKKDYTRRNTAYSACEINETHISEQAALRIGQPATNGIDNLVANGQEEERTIWHWLVLQNIQRQYVHPILLLKRMY